jgi:hypothetical protein
MLTRLALVALLSTLGVAAAAPAVVETARSVAEPVVELPQRGDAESRAGSPDRPLVRGEPGPRARPESADAPLVEHDEGCAGHPGKGHHKARGKGHHKARGKGHHKSHGKSKHAGKGKSHGKGKHAGKGKHKR